jgi:L-threonate 2-dehydrogenase
MRVGVIGLGSMGMGVALSLVRAGHAVFGCDVRAPARAELAAAGGTGVASPAALPADLAALVLLVVNAAQVDAVLFGPEGCASRLPSGAVVLSSVTMAPEAARALAARLEGLGLLALDAPVSGGPVRAREGALSVMASGSPAAFAAAEPVLAAIAQKVWRLGDAPGVGSTVKMVN